MDIDAVIIDVEFQVEPKYNLYGHFIALRFIDTVPARPRLLGLIREITKNNDVELIDYKYTETVITAKTNLKGLEITLN